MGEMENQAEFVYEKLKTSTNPARVILDFYREITGKDISIMMVNKLLKLFGRFTLYFSVMELSKYEDKLDGNVYPLLYTICRSRFEKIHAESFSPSHESLDKSITSLEKEIERVRKMRGKLPSSEGLE